MVTSPERLRPVNDCTANYRPVILSERMLHFNNQAIGRLKKRKNLVMGHKEGPTPRQTDRLTTVCYINDNDGKKLPGSEDRSHQTW
jgi:hypothetical protein